MAEFDNRHVEIVLSRHCKSQECSDLADRIAAAIKGVREETAVLTHTQYNEGRKLRVDPESVALSESAEKIMRESEPRITFGEALRKARAEKSSVKFRESNPQLFIEGSVELSERAEQIERERKISFGEALRIARRER